MNLTLKEILIAGGPIFLFLIILSIYSFAIIMERYKYLKKNFSQNKELINKINHYLKEEDIKPLIVILEKSKTIQGEILLKLVKYEGNAQEKREFYDKLIDWYSIHLSKRLNALATIGSTTPFIGLFGTVIGVIRAFKDMAAFQSAGPSVIASGISEALVNTAAGLFVAIPAIVAYNYFISKINQNLSDINVISEKLIIKSTKSAIGINQ
jgi:biopolymer transport protein ExbB/biopolymer transport protein TolQ